MPGSRVKTSETREWLMSLQGRGWGTTLDGMREAMGKLGDPQNELRAIHVAGTNGKGSVCAIASAILQAAGMDVGLYTSPHLMDVKERIAINNRKIGERALAELIVRARDILEGDGISTATKLTFFEFVTAIGMMYFVERDVDVAVIEVGFGGRLDATNVLPSSVAAITQIGLDHTEYLGKTIEAIATEKAGIIKKGCTVVSSAGDPSAMGVIGERALAQRCTLVENGKDFLAKNIRASLSGTTFDYRGARDIQNLRTNLLGRHQAENAATAIAACDELARREGFAITDSQIEEGLRNVQWHGRLEIVSRKPLTILDCGHNPPAIRKLMESLADLGINPDTVIYASSKDKDYTTSTSILFPKAKRLILTRYGAPRSVEPEILAQLPSAQGKPVFLSSDIAEALEISKEVTPREEVVLIVGSVFLVGDALSWLRLGRKADFSLAGMQAVTTPKIN
jgi:dihydrofolate synthase / folylpolyglutamate synthase